MGDALEYNDIHKEDRGALNVGRMRLGDSGITFKSHKTGKVESISKNEFKELHWQRLSSSFALRIMLDSGQLYRFMGFMESDYDKLQTYIEKTYRLDLEPKELCLKGWNWGTANFDGNVLSFDIDSKSAFEIPLNYVSHCTSAKNEVTLEFHQNDGAAVSLMELRFHLPSQSDGMDHRVTAFTEAVLSKANIIQATGDAIVTFSELQCLTPRGRYDIKLFPSFIQLHGKTFDYKIPLTTVLRLFRLPHKDGRQVFFVLSLDPPIKQGQTRYHFLILLFNKEDETSVELTISSRDLKEKFDGKLEKEMSGATIDVLGQVMKVLVQRKITLPASIGASGSNPAISCSYRAGAGLLYLLERGFIYIHKPPVHIRFDEILSINFARSGGSTRSFDFEVETKSGIVHTFSSIYKEEYQKIYDFVTNKKLRVKNRGTEPAASATINDDLIDSDDEEQPDAYLARVKHEGKMREEEGDSDESDESFNPDASESDAGSGGDGSGSSGSSDDSDGSSGSDASADERPKKKDKPKPKAKPIEKKEKKEVTKKRGKKDKKDENKPKKPMSAYFLWLNESREKLKKDYPGLSLVELTKKAGEIWREKIGDKSKWENLAKEAKKRYEKEMAEYNASGGGVTTSKKSSKSPKSKASKGDKRDDKKKSTSSPTKSSGAYKSKEYISDSDSSSEDEKPTKKQAKPTRSDKDSGSDVEMKSNASESEPESDSS